MTQSLTRSILIVNAKGLHARASAKLVATAESFDARLTVSAHGETADARSIMDILTLAAGQGDSVALCAEGPEAAAALAAAAALIEDGFGERD